MKVCSYSHEEYWRVKWWRQTLIHIHILILKQKQKENENGPRTQYPLRALHNPDLLLRQPIQRIHHAVDFAVGLVDDGGIHIINEVLVKLIYSLSAE